MTRDTRTTRTTRVARTTPTTRPARTRTRRLLLAGLGAVALAVAPVAAAGAADAAEAPAQSCSYDLGTASLVCVPVGEDLDAAVLAEQHLAVVQPGADAPAGAGTAAASRAAGLSAPSPAAVLTTYVQAKLYDDVNYGGAFFQITNSRACNSVTVFQFGPLSSVGWSGRVSSFTTSSGCTAKLWSGASYSGSSYGYSAGAASLGGMNDLANSVSLK